MLAHGGGEGADVADGDDHEVSLAASAASLVRVDTSVTRRHGYTAMARIVIMRTPASLTYTPTARNRVTAMARPAAGRPKSRA